MRISEALSTPALVPTPTSCSRRWEFSYSLAASTCRCLMIISACVTAVSVWGKAGGASAAAGCSSCRVCRKSCLLLSLAVSWEAGWCTFKRIDVNPIVPIQSASDFRVLFITNKSYKEPRKEPRVCVRYIAPSSHYGPAVNDDENYVIRDGRVLFLSSSHAGCVCHRS